MDRVSLQKFIFYISGMLCCCSLFAGPAELPESVSLGGVLYVQNEGKWFISHNGQLSEEIILDTLILRRPDRLNVISKLTVNPGLSPVQIRDVLRDSAEKVPGYDYNWSQSQPGHSLKMGYGRLRANNALVLAAQKPTVNLVSPQIGTNFSIGAQVPITWDRKNFTGSVRIKLYNSRGYVRTLASSLTGSSYFWTNPGDMVDGHDYRVKLESTSDPTIYDYTDRPFSLEGLAILSIPDEIFLQSLLEEGYDLNADQQIDVGEASQITTLDISQRGIKDLSGLQYFSNLQSLDCSANRITDMGPVAENQAFMSRCDKSIDFSYNLINKSSAYGVCSIACSPWLAFEADHQQSLEYCLCWDPPCGSGKQ